MIDEKKLIEQLKGYKSEWKLAEPFHEGIASGLQIAIEATEKQPKVGEWILVSERLPEVGSQVLVSTRHGVVYGDIYYDYSHSSSKYPCFHKWDDEMWQCFRPDVIAWMPLPSPYREEGAE